MRHEAEAARLWARHPTHRRRVDRARAIIAAALARASRPYVAFSAGKDSAAMLALVREQAPAIEARMLTWPETELLGDYVRTVEAWRSLGADIRAVAMTRARLDDAVPDRWHRLHGDSDLVFVGLRRDESRARQITLNRLGVIHKPATGITRAAPLAGLRTIDVAAIVVSRGLPVLSLYERDGFGARSSTRVPRASHSIRETMLAELRESDPPAYASLCQLYPEIAGRAPEEIGEGAA